MTLPRDRRATDAAIALLAANRRRRRVRVWGLVVLAPFVLAGLFLSGKILSMYAFAHQAITSSVIGDYAGSEQAAHGQEFLNWFEPYKAPYNVGVALAGAEELAQSRGKFEEALPLAPGLEACAVRVNLALVIERQGDAAVADGDAAAGAQFYGEALLVTADTPDECHSEEADEQSPDPDRDMGDSLDGLEDRLQEKQQQTQNPSPDPQEDGEQQTTPGDDALQDLEDQLGQGAQEREQRQQDESGESGSGSGTDKPW